MTTSKTLARNANALFRFINNNGGRMGTRYFDTEEGRAEMGYLVSKGRAKIDGTDIVLVHAEPNGQKSTKTDKAPAVTLDTPVSVQVGSDCYEAKVERVTDATVTVVYNRKHLTFRPHTFTNTHTMRDGEWVHPTGWVSSSYVLVLGVSETRLDPSF